MLFKNFSRTQFLAWAVVLFVSQLGLLSLAQAQLIPELSQLQLVDADENKVLANLEDGAIIEILDLELTNLGFVALTNPAIVGSVDLTLTGPSFTGGFNRMEGFSPYSIFGDNALTGINGQILIPGTYTLRAIPFGERLGQGLPGEALEVTFEIRDLAEFSVNQFVLFDGISDQAITELNDGDQVGLDLVNGRFNFVANTDPATVGSVRFQVSGPENVNRVENTAPYASFGDQSGDFFPETLEAGIYTLTATPYSQPNAQGDVGTPLSIQVEIFNQVGEAIIRFTQVDPIGETVTLKNVGTADLDISEYWLCLGPGQYNNVADYSEITGDLNLSPEEEVTLNITTGGNNITALPDANGGLGLFANTNFGSNSGEDKKDYVQWGAANQNRVGQAVNAGRWDDAANFVGNEAPYNYIGGANDVGAAFWEGTIAGEAIIRLLQVDPIGETVTLKNVGTADLDISEYWLCLGPGQYNNVADYSEITGDLNLSPEEEVTLNITTGGNNITALPDANGGLGLFANTNFGSNSGEDKKDYVQWGAANQNRVGQAVNAGRWDDAANFVSGTAPYVYNGTANDVGAAFWSGNISSVSLKVYPNPSVEQLFIEGPADKLIQVFNQKGEIVYEGSLEDGKLNIKALSSGLYTIRAGAETRRVLIK